MPPTPRQPPPNKVPPALPRNPAAKRKRVADGAGALTAPNKRDLFNVSKTHDSEKVDPTIKAAYTIVCKLYELLNSPMSDHMAIEEVIGRLMDMERDLGAENKGFFSQILQNREEFKTAFLLAISNSSFSQCSDNTAMKWFGKEIIKFYEYEFPIVENSCPNPGPLKNQSIFGQKICEIAEMGQYNDPAVGSEEKLYQIGYSPPPPPSLK